MAMRRSTRLASANRPPPTARTTNPNRLLAALPPDDYNRLVPKLDLIPLKLKEFLHRPGERLQHVYFPGGGVCSVLTQLEDGDMIEVATIGRDGIAGVSAVLHRRP